MNAKLSFYLERHDTTTAVGNVDLYGLGKRDSSTVVAGDFWGDTNALDTTDATLLQNDILTPTSPTSLVYTSVDISSYLNQQYASGAGISKYVFLRLSTDADLGNSQRYFITSANGAAIASAGAPNRSIWPQVDFTLVPDADLDGLPDSWELQYFNSLNKTADGDEDGDGSTNLTEYIAGTDPGNALSSFRIKSPTIAADGNFTLRWDSVSRRNYNVMKSNTLVGDWINVSASLPGTGGELFFTATTNTITKQFYKVQVTNP